MPYYSSAPAAALFNGKSWLRVGLNPRPDRRTIRPSTMQNTDMNLKLMLASDLHQRIQKCDDLVLRRMNWEPPLLPHNQTPDRSEQKASQH